MRIFIEVIENLTETVRVIVGLVVLLIMGCAMIFAFGASYVATGAAENFAESAEKLGEEAIEAQREAELKRALAEDGWGYEAGLVDRDAADRGKERARGRDPREDSRGAEDDWASGF